MEMMMTRTRNTTRGCISTRTGINTVMTKMGIIWGYWGRMDTYMMNMEDIMMKTVLICL